MLETMQNPMTGNVGFSQLQSFGIGDNRDNSSEEELSVLPENTRVVVTGNNRTKSVLVGLRGVVKKAVGLGGWHWLVLTNGIEVKLQRNALSVIEGPTDFEEDQDIGFENFQWNGFVSDDTQKVHRSRDRKQRSSRSLSHRTQSLCCDTHTKSPAASFRGKMKIDLSKLEIAALWRYLRHFNLVDSITNSSKQELINVVQKHFMSQKLDELQVIVGFVHAARRLKKMSCKNNAVEFSN